MSEAPEPIIVGLLKALLDYLLATRQCGHTRAMLEGALSTENVVILAASLLDVRALRERCQTYPNQTPLTLVCLGDLPLPLRAPRRPLLVDNHTLLVLLNQTLGLLDELKWANSQLKAQQERAKIARDILEEQLAIVRELLAKDNADKVAAEKRVTELQQLAGQLMQNVNRLQEQLTAAQEQSAKEKAAKAVAEQQVKNLERLNNV